MKYAFTLLFLFSFFIFSDAQVCEGITDELVYQETFGSGANNPGPALPPGTTDYNYGNIGAGNYTVVNDSGQNGNLWHSGPDHTPGDENGYMLLFDGSSIADLFFRTVIDELCPNTNYSFSAWIANVGKPSGCGGNSAEPNLIFEIRDASTGEVLGQTMTGAIEPRDEMTWVEIGISFRLPANISSIEVSIRNTVDGGCGNDFAIDDFSLNTCNPVTEQSFSICLGEEVRVGDRIYTAAGNYQTLLPIPGSCNDSLVITAIEVGDNFTNTVYRICEGESVQVGDQAYSESGIYIDTIVDPLTNCTSILRSVVLVGQDSEQHIDTLICTGESLVIGGEFFSESGDYEITLASSFGCDSIIHLNLTVFDFDLNLSPTVIQLELGEGFRPQLNISPPGDYQIQWSPADWVDCTDCEDPTVIALQSDTLLVQVLERETGCLQETSIQVEILPCDNFYLPNVFSPNGDGVNDCFEIYGGDCVREILTMEIYDRWGGQVFQELSPDVACWDGLYRGKMASTGIYVYRVEVELIDLTRIELYGDVALIR